MTDAQQQGGKEVRVLGYGMSFHSLLHFLSCSTIQGPGGKKRKRIEHFLRVYSRYHTFLLDFASREATRSTTTRSILRNNNKLESNKMTTMPSIRRFSYPVEIGKDVVSGSGGLVPQYNRHFRNLVAQWRPLYDATSCHYTKKQISIKVYFAILEDFGGRILDVHGQEMNTNKAVLKCMKALKDAKRWTSEGKQKARQERIQRIQLRRQVACDNDKENNINNSNKNDNTDQDNVDIDSSTESSRHPEAQEQESEYDHHHGRLTTTSSASSSSPSTLQTPISCVSDDLPTPPFQLNTGD
jgi:hypothetical protein